MMLHHVKRLLKPAVKSLNCIRIYKSALLSNYTHLCGLQSQGAIFPVLKSNAYGHGLEQVSRILKDVDTPLICVDSFPEYQIVKRRSGKKVLVMGETIPENYKWYDHQCASLAVFTFSTLRRLVAHRKPFKIHLFLNTGMNREGIQADQLPTFLEELKAAKHLTLEGVMSHFATADEPDRSFMDQQTATFEAMYRVIESYGFTPKRRHLGNSAGVAKMKNPLFTAWRSGKALYGYNHLLPEDPFHTLLEPLKPALSVHSTVIALQHLEPGDSVSYARTFIAQRPTVTATLPFGYYEGLNRKLSNRWQLKRHDTYLPLVGNICMNLCSFDTQGNNVQIGDEVELISADKTAPNAVVAFAKTIDTISYEVLVKLTEKTRRIIVT